MRKIFYKKWGTDNIVLYTLSGISFELLSKKFMQNNLYLLQMIQDTAEKIQFARFNPDMDDTVFAMPVNIVRILKADNEGNILFFTYCKKAIATEITNFGASLDFYKKHEGPVLHVQGMAKIIQEETIITDNFQLIHFKASHVVYKGKLSVGSWKQKLLENINHWLFNDNKK